MSEAQIATLSHCDSVFLQSEQLTKEFGTLAKVPTEIRLQIWEEALRNDDHCDDPVPIVVRYSSAPALLRVNRAVGREVLEVYFEKHEFDIFQAGNRFDQFLARNDAYQLVRSLEIDSCGTSGVRQDDGLHRAIQIVELCCNLRLLRIRVLLDGLNTFKGLLGKTYSEKVVKLPKLESFVVDVDVYRPQGVQELSAQGR
ncbi:hypothetical protein EJ08DRAFT_662386 [Tothia fuscella]|uniref:Uncharacterized protein n=1 Tax=Tothia fuscella TaxID=1048955 RepID=A0A9P4NN14_9PEZI|nr:hypothetical protein EJ08DRAFT_662386 [Tothia fuscella]